MNYSKLIPTFVTFAALTAAGSAPAAAADRGTAQRGPIVVRHAAPRSVPIYRSVVVRPGIGRAVPFRPYYYPYRPRFGAALYVGYPYGYYPYAYAGYGHYGPYGYPGPGVGYVAAVSGRPYGSVRIEGAPRDAQVFVDGYYTGIVDDFDGAFQQLDLPPGPHRIEIRVPGLPPQEVDVRVEPGQTITYHARLPGAPR